MASCVSCNCNFVKLQVINTTSVLSSAKFKCSDYSHLRTMLAVLLAIAGISSKVFATIVIRISSAKFTMEAPSETGNLRISLHITFHSVDQD